jgi:hypothetical protein
VKTAFRWGDLWEGDYLEDLGVDWRIILKFIIMKWDEKVWTGLIWLRIGTGTGFCECINGTSGSTECGEFFE